MRALRGYDPARFFSSKVGGQVGQLMNHRLGLRVDRCTLQRARIVHVDDRGGSTGGFQFARRFR
jgi:hypothetical protein